MRQQYFLARDKFEKNLRTKTWLEREALRASQMRVAAFHAMNLLS